VCSPGSEVLSRVLDAPDTEFFYFFAVAGGRHVFSRSFDEHRAAVSRGRALP
jgi:cell division protein YceG involved in septum cleavage